MNRHPTLNKWQYHNKLITVLQKKYAQDLNQLPAGPSTVLMTASCTGRVANCPIFLVTSHILTPLSRVPPNISPGRRMFRFFPKNGRMA